MVCVCVIERWRIEADATRMPVPDCGEIRDQRPFFLPLIDSKIDANTVCPSSLLNETIMLNTNTNLVLARRSRSRRGLLVASLAIPLLPLVARSQDGASLFVRVLCRYDMVCEFGAATGGLYGRFRAGGNPGILKFAGCRIIRLGKLTR